MNNTLLIIEDNEQNLYMMRFLLKMNGFTIFGAGNGLQGIEMALKYNPQAILLDIQLPEMDGYEVAAEAEKTPPTQKGPDYRCHLLCHGWGSGKYSGCGCHRLYRKTHQSRNLYCRNYGVFTSYRYLGEKAA
jgi:hypothetical protein